MSGMDDFIRAQLEMFVSSFLDVLSNNFQPPLKYISSAYKIRCVCVCVWSKKNDMI